MLLLNRTNRISRWVLQLSSLMILVLVLDTLSQTAEALPHSDLPHSAPSLRRKRALDSLEGDDFSLRKRALDLMDGDDFGFQKRALDTLEGDDFVGLKKRKRALDSLDGEGFGGFNKRALDSLDGEGFGGFNKRALDMLDGDGFGLKKRSKSDAHRLRRALENLNRNRARLMGERIQRLVEKRSLDALEGNSFGF